MTRSVTWKSRAILLVSTVLGCWAMVSVDRADAYMNNINFGVRVVPMPAPRFDPVLRGQHLNQGAEDQNTQRRAKAKSKPVKATKATTSTTSAKVRKLITTRTIKPTIVTTGAIAAGGAVSSPAGTKIDSLKDKLGIEALGDVQGAAALPAALGTPDNDPKLPEAGGTPGTAGPAMTLDSPQDQAADAAADRVLADVSRLFGARGAPSQSGQVDGNGRMRERWTWDLGDGRKLEVTESRDRGFTTEVTRSGRVQIVMLHDEHGRRERTLIFYPDGSRETQNYHEGLLTGWVRTNRDGTVDDFGGPSGTSVWARPANPNAGGSGNNNSGSDTGGNANTNSGGQQTASTMAGSSASSNSNNSSNNASGSSGSGNSNSNSGSGDSGGSSSSGNDNTGSGSSSESGNSNTGGNDNADSGNEIGPSKDASQPNENTSSKGNPFAERGLVHPGERPKQTARGSDDRVIPNASGVIIRREGGPTPGELKAAVTQPGIGEQPSTSTGGGSLRTASDFAQPPAGGVPGSPGSTSTTGAFTTSTGGGLVNPNPSDPAEQR